MTFSDLSGTMARRWYVLVAVVLAGAALFATLASGGGVYSSEPVISFAFPGARVVAPDNGISDENVIAFALTVAESVNDGKPVQRYAAETAPLYGAGVRQGVRVAVPDVGGQWGSSYTRAQIVVSIVGPTRQWVRSRQDQTIRAVFEASDGEQALRGVPTGKRITPSILPLSTRVEYIGSSGLARMLALAALGAATLIAAVWACVAVENVAASVHARAARRPAGTPPYEQAHDRAGTPGRPVHARERA